VHGCAVLRHCAEQCSPSAPLQLRSALLFPALITSCQTSKPYFSSISFLPTHLPPSQHHLRCSSSLNGASGSSEALPPAAPETAQVRTGYLFKPDGEKSSTSSGTSYQPVGTGLASGASSASTGQEEGTGSSSVGTVTLLLLPVLLPLCAAIYMSLVTAFPEAHLPPLPVKEMQQYGQKLQSSVSDGFSSMGSSLSGLQAASAEKFSQLQAASSQQMAAAQKAAANLQAASGEQLAAAQKAAANLQAASGEQLAAAQKAAANLQAASGEQLAAAQKAAANLQAASGEQLAAAQKAAQQAASSLQESSAGAVKQLGSATKQ